MENTLDIFGQDGRFLLSIANYENENAEDVYDSNWLTCTVDIKVSSFQATVNASITSQDLSRFYQSLQRAYTQLSGTALLDTDEDTVSLKIEFVNSGVVYVSGSIQTIAQFKVHLSYMFESHHSNFSDTLSYLSALMQRFPIRA